MTNKQEATKRVISKICHTNENWVDELRTKIENGEIRVIYTGPTTRLPWVGSPNRPADWEFGYGDYRYYITRDQSRPELFTMDNGGRWEKVNQHNSSIIALYNTLEYKGSREGRRADNLANKRKIPNPNVSDTWDGRTPVEKTLYFLVLAAVISALLILTAVSVYLGVDHMEFAFLISFVGVMISSGLCIRNATKIDVGKIFKTLIASLTTVTGVVAAIVTISKLTF